MSSTSTNDTPTCLLGMHYIAEITGCPADGISTVDSVAKPFLAALARNGATILSHTTHQFDPAGATAVVLLADSHASLHTWPENNSICIDIFTCSDALDAYKALEELALEFKGELQKVRALERAVPE